MQTNTNNNAKKDPNYESLNVTTNLFEIRVNL